MRTAWVIGMECVPPPYCEFPSHPPPVPVRLAVLPDEACPYLPGRVATHRAALAPDRLSPEVYHAFMDRGFRRSGRLVYQPVCRGCRACVPLRVPVDAFTPSTSQRRCERRNADLGVTVGVPEPTPEKHDLYQRYTRDWHGRSDPSTWEDFAGFLFDSPVDTLEFTYRDPSGRLLAVGICDRSAAALSSVYHYFDPTDAPRGLGTYGALREIRWARERGVRYYYLGYWVHGCRRMEYKASYRPCEILDADGVWRSM